MATACINSSGSAYPAGVAVWMSAAGKEFGDSSVKRLERLLQVTLNVEHHKDDEHIGFLAALPDGAGWLLVGILQHSTSDEYQATGIEETLAANTTAIVRALHRHSRIQQMGSYSTSTLAGTTVDGFGQHILTKLGLLQDYPFGGSPSSKSSRKHQHMRSGDDQLEDYNIDGNGGSADGWELSMVCSEEDRQALAFLAETLRSTSKSGRASDLASILASSSGQQFLHTLATSPTLSVGVMFAWWDDVWDWIKGAAAWVAEAVTSFGEEAAKMADALVQSVFSKYPGAIKFVDNVPFLGMLVAFVYSVAGKYPDQALASLAINLNATVTFLAGVLGFMLGGPIGDMVGSAVGKTVGLLLQEAIAQGIKDPNLRAEVGDISAAQFVAEVAMAGVTGGFVGIGASLASEAGIEFFWKLVTSQGLATLFGRLPSYLMHDDDKKEAAKSQDQPSGRSHDRHDSYDDDDYDRKHHVRT